MDIFRQWRLALRGLARRPAYAATAVIVLALGIGATATLFSVVNTVLLRPLPFPASGQLALVLAANPAKRQNASLVSPAEVADWNRMNQAFVPGLGITGLYGENDTDTSGSMPQRLAAVRVLPGFFGVYGMPALRGRTFIPAEDATTGPGAAVISYGYWTRRYGRSLSALGQHLVLGGVAYTIVGVMPADFTSSATEAWLPAKLPQSLLSVREARFLTCIGRLRAGVTLAAAQADLGRIQAQQGRKYTAERGWSAQVSSLKTNLVGDDSAALWIVFGATLLLLLLAVANIAGLTLAQLQGRRRELAIRTALGGSARQVAAGVLRECLWLAAIGAAGGGALAWAGVRAIAGLAPGTLPRMAELSFDGRGWAFAVVVSALAAAAFGLLPALGATRPRQGRLAGLLVSLNAGAPGGRRRAQHGLVVAQFALTVLLVAAAGLLWRSYYNLNHVTAGFEPGNVLTFHIGAAWNENRTQVGAMQHRVLDQLDHLPGVVAAGFTNFLPASDATLQYQILLQGLAGPAQNGAFSAGERSVSPGYFASLKVPIVAGGDCPAMPIMTDAEVAGTALVNESFVRTYLRGQAAVGREWKVAQDGPTAPWSRIVGVVGDVRENSLAEAPTPFIYACIPAGGWPDPNYVVRTAGGAGPTLAALRGLVAKSAPGRALFGVEPLTQLLAAGLAQPQLEADCLAMFAGFALLLAAVGLYGLISLMVLAQRRELGVRLALGARPSQLARTVLAGAARLVGWGAAAGLLLTWAAGHALRAVLYGISPFDGATLTAAVAVLAAIALLAAWLPARRAAATDPLVALKSD
ncbi:MAG: ADOP family duplicated permease [Terriglobales bacterium]